MVKNKQGGILAARASYELWKKEIALHFNLDYLPMMVICLLCISTARPSFVGE